MANDTRTLVLNIHANTEIARAHLAALVGTVGTTGTQVDAKLSDLEAKFTKTSKGVGLAVGLIGSAIGGLGVGTFVSIAREVLQFADDLDSAAKSAGVNVERFQTLREGFRSLDVPVEKVDDVLRRLTDTLGSVQGGTAAKGVVAALDAMGISSRIVSGEITTADQLLDAIAGSAGRFKTQAEFTAKVVDVLGKSIGVDLASALADGGKALHDSEQAFRDSGNVIDKEYIAKLADANEAIDKFKTRSQSQLAIWAAEVIGDFGAVTAALREYIDTHSGIEKYDPINLIDTVTDTAAKREQDRADAVAEAAAKVRDAALIARLPAGSAFRAQQQAQFDVRFGLADSVTKFAAGSKSPTAPTADTTVTGAKAAKAAKPGKVELTPAQIRLNEVQDGVPDARQIVDTILASGGDGLDKLITNFDLLQAKAIDLSKVEIIDAEQQQRVEDFGMSLSQNIGQALIYGQKLGPALVNSLKAAAAEALTSGIFKLLTGGGEGGGSGVLGAVVSGIGSLFGGGFAGGGDPPVGKWSLVGEKGVELIKPRGAMTVIPNHLLGGGGGGGGITVNQSLAVNLAGNAATREDAAMFAAIARDQAIDAYRQIFNSGIPVT